MAITWDGALIVKTGSMSLMGVVRKYNYYGLCKEKESWREQDTFDACVVTRRIYYKGWVLSRGVWT